MASRAMASFVCVFWLIVAFAIGQELSPQEIRKTGALDARETTELPPSTTYADQDSEKSETGAVYVRWGKSSCPDYAGTVLVYAGAMGGALIYDTGGGSGYLCMPYDPQYSKSTFLGQSNRASVWGTEYRVEHFPFTVPYRGIKSLMHHDVPCAVCMSISRHHVLMIPARYDCYDGWKTEYLGYVMTGQKTDLGRTQHVCMDKDPDTVPGGFRAENGSVVIPVEAKCGSLPCPPYAEGYEFSCIVCTK